MGRPPIRVKLTITPSDDNRFSNPRTFNSIPEASSRTGLTDRGIRATYHLKRESMRKKSGEVYKNCIKCSKNLTPEDRSSFFLLDRGNDDESLQFVSIYWA